MPRSPATNVLRIRWIFRRKDPSKSSGIQFEKLKARLVIRSLQQIYEKKYDETFAPVEKCSTL